MAARSVAPPVGEALPIGLNLVAQTLREASKSDVSFLQDTAQNLVDAGGKRLRPRLLFMSFLASGGDPFPKPVIDAATAIELLHTASLIHDDILDDADVRRGRPTVHRQIGTSRAILAGDFLFAGVLNLLTGLPPDVRDAVVRAGLDLCQGEALELELTRKGASTLEQYFQVIAQKTASLLETSAYAGARLAGAAPEICRGMADYGFYAGIAFQLVDDLLDVEGITEVTGKPAGLDLAHGVPNAALLVALEGQLRRGKKLVPLATSRATHPDTTRQIVESSKAPQRVLELAEMYATRALDAIRILPPSPSRTELEGLLRENLTRKR